MPALTWRPGYARAAALLLLVEVVIALWIRDRFVRPYLGDLLAVILVYLSLRAISTLRPRPAAIIAFLVGLIVEVGQAAGLLELVGLADQGFARVLFGTSFSVGDIVCYTVGAVLALAVDRRRTIPTA